MRSSDAISKNTSNIVHSILAEPVLSVIIPCYNCAPIIKRCIGSIDYQDCEILVVNDGSTDNVVEIMSQYISSHPNVRLLNKPNGGVSSARNLGIENAHGKYISFIDADDYIVRGGLERIVKIAEENNADVVKFKNISVRDTDSQDLSSVEDTPIKTEITTGSEVLNGYEVSDYIVWDGIYRRDVIIDNNLRFITDLSLREDDTFMGMLYCHANRVVVTDLQLYRYVRSSQFSSTHNQKVEKQRKLIKSGLMAIRYRSQYVKQYHPEVMDLERLKYMRWVCTIQTAVSAEMTYKEYRTLLDEFHKESAYPLKYTWIKVAGWDYAFIPYMKKVIQTFLVNHPYIGWPLVKLRCWMIK